MNFKIRSEELNEGLNFIDIYENELIGTAEIDYTYDKIFLENIVRDRNYSGKRILISFINYLSSFGKDIVCLPLPKYVSYYESLGFRLYQQIGEDKYYIKKN